MTHFLITDDNPKGYKLEHILKQIRNDVMQRATKIMDDPIPEAQHVLNNNIEILGLLSEAISLAEDSTQVLDKSFGISGDKPRIGKE